MQKPTLTVAGLYTDPSALSEVPEGALSEAVNVVIDRPGIAEKRPGFKAYGDSVAADGIFFFDDKLWVDVGGTLKYWTGSAWSSDAAALDDAHVARVVSGKSLYLSDGAKVKKVPQAGATPASQTVGLPTPFVTSVTHTTTSRVGIGDDGVSGDGYAYRFTVAREDEHGVVIESAPSARYLFMAWGASHLSSICPQFVVDVGDNVAAYSNAKLRAYRSAPVALQSPGVRTAIVTQTMPADEYYLVDEVAISSSTVTYTDRLEHGSYTGSRPEGTALYTNASEQGAAAANQPAPAAYDIAVYNGYTFYLRPVFPHRLVLTMDAWGVSTPQVASGTTFTIGPLSLTAGSSTSLGTTFRTFGDSNSFNQTNVNAATDEIAVATVYPAVGDTVWIYQAGGLAALTSNVMYRISSALSGVFKLAYELESSFDTAVDLSSAAGTGLIHIVGTRQFGACDQLDIARPPSTNDTIRQEMTLRSLVRAINYQRSTSRDWYAEVLKGDSGTPLGLLIQSSEAFTFTHNGSSQLFAEMPIIGSLSSSNDYADNKLAWSKQYEPESVPLTNVHPGIGSALAKALRILATRDSLMILKADGLYKLTGAVDTAFQVDPVDTSVSFVAPKTAALLDNSVYAMTTDGVTRATDLGQQLVSNPIRSELLAYRGNTQQERDTFDTYSTAFVWGHRYVLCVAHWDGAAVTYPVQYVLNTRTGTWTTWDADIRYGAESPYDGRLYVYRGNSYVERLALPDEADAYEDRTQLGGSLPVPATVAWTVKSMEPTSLNQFTGLTVLSKAGEASVDDEAFVTTSTDTNQTEVDQAIKVKTGKVQPSRVSVPRNHQRASTLSVRVTHAGSTSFEVSGLAITGQLTSEKTAK